MQVIIKPTSKCNFNCSFCSAKLLDIKHSNNVPQVLKDYLLQIKPENIIITGGEPLCMSMEYFNELLSLGNWTLSITSNLKLFYNNPDYWEPLFKNERVDVVTSFQYGNGRIDGDVVYTEEEFIKVITLFKEKIGYTPSFISIISEENEDKALDHVYLAKRLGTTCKLNGLMPMGLSKGFYPRYKMMKIWLKIIELGLEKYEDNCIERAQGKCNFNQSFTCDRYIRVCYVDNYGNLHKSFCEDLISENIEVEESDKKPLKQDCYLCELYRICNGCMKNKIHSKKDDKFCEEMLKLKDKIIKSGWLL